MIKDIKKITKLPMDVHLMIDRPERYVTRFAEAGADILTIHVESSEKTEQTLEQIKADGVIPAVSVKPSTPVETVFPYLYAKRQVLPPPVQRPVPDERRTLFPDTIFSAYKKLLPGKRLEVRLLS